MVKKLFSSLELSIKIADLQLCRIASATISNQQLTIILLPLPGAAGHLAESQIAH